MGRGLRYFRWVRRDSRIFEQVSKDGKTTKGFDVLERVRQMIFAQNPQFFQFGSNRQLDRIADICYLNFNRQHPDEDGHRVFDPATDCDSSGYIHNLKFALIPLSNWEYYQLSMVN
jgi:hypothetical protein